MNADPSLPLFVYGTLCDPHIRALVLGQRLADEALQRVSAPGWRAVYIPGVLYPALVANQDDAADGLLIEGLSAAALARLDVYEGNQYRREALLVRSGNNTVGAQAYLPRRAISANAPRWDFEHWTRIHRSDFLREEFPPAGIEKDNGERTDV
ncbi:gamma-glutamylcyclotransferase family protein [Pelagibacterium limicola]|uniref:gamma-glutamylcyclotransferase family protein n=1 Tax=Pelagibacterium limicola TaxID=2791022 RepID=UPI0018AF6DAA|nr:gamma-glutamylcyclotransferase family protein [Pelagibacterium limicola]